jgi:hypothetical protein
MNMQSKTLYARRPGERPAAEVPISPALMRLIRRQVALERQLADVDAKVKEGVRKLSTQRGLVSPLRLEQVRNEAMSNG